MINPNGFLVKISSIALALALSGCAANNPRIGVHLLTFRDYAHSVAADRSKHPRTSQLYDAAHGDSVAIHACFARTVERMKQPAILAGEDIEILMNEMDYLFYSLGDRRFAEALARESASTRSALNEFIDPKRLEGSTAHTKAIFAATPHHDFPANVTTREDAARS